MLCAALLMAVSYFPSAAGPTDSVKSFRPLPGSSVPRGEPLPPRGSGVSRRTLPFAHGRTFSTLDAYLDHLRRYAGPVGQPWYRRLGPGTYELVTTMVPVPRRRTFTRAELMRQFGFTR